MGNKDIIKILQNKMIYPDEQECCITYKLMRELLICASKYGVGNSTQNK